MRERLRILCGEYAARMFDKGVLLAEQADWVRDLDYAGQASRADTDRLAAQRLGAADRQRGVLETMCGGPVPDVCAK